MRPLKEPKSRGGAVLYWVAYRPNLVVVVLLTVTVLVALNYPEVSASPDPMLNRALMLLKKINTATIGASLGYGWFYAFNQWGKEEVKFQRGTQLWVEYKKLQALYVAAGAICISLMVQS